MDQSQDATLLRRKTQESHSSCFGALKTERFSIALRGLQLLPLISPEQAQVVLLKDALGYSFEEIATAAGMPVGTAKCHAHRGRARLSERLEDNAA